MTKEEIFSAWAPDSSIWSRWAKPVLFANLDSALSHVTVSDRPNDLGWVPPADGKTALVLDLPGALGVLDGIVLAGLGYRPVPLYNAIPLPYGQQLLNPLRGVTVAAVDVLPIISALRAGADMLSKLSVAPTASPAFLLDSNRHGAHRVLPDQFDNRSISFTTDFPSVTFLYAQGVREIILIQKDSLAPKEDLAHTLRRWQDGGLLMKRACLDPFQAPQQFEVSKPSWYRAMFQRALALRGHHRAEGGGFGNWLAGSAG